MPAQETQKQISALIMSTLLFAACFATWTLISVIGLQIKQDLQLSETQFGLLVATPILSGALACLPMGILAERFGGRKLMLGVVLLVSIPLYGFAYAQYYWQYLALGLCIGFVGSTFVIGIHYVSSWASRENQGLAMGVFGAGNLGAALTNLVAPLIIIAYGWRMGPIAYAFVLVLLALFFWLLTQDDPVHQRRSQERKSLSLGQILTPLRELRVWRFGLYYFFMFGGYIALTLWLPDYYVYQYGLDLKSASFITLLFTVPGALARILGGWCADHIGARQVNWSVFWVCLFCLFFLSYPPTTMTIHGLDGDFTFALEMPVWLFTALIMVVGVAMGIGSSSVFRVVYDYYPDRMGTVGGAVGLLGAIGGFILPIMFGLVTDLFGVRSSCFMMLYGLLAVCMTVMYYGINRQESQNRLQEAIRNNFLQEKLDS